MTEKELSTKERIMESSLELFSQQGFDRTSIGDIEEASGLSRRSGAFYRHFDSKKDLLEVVIDRQIEGVEQMRSTLDMVPLNDFEAEVRFLLQWGLKLIDQGHRIYITLLPLKEEFPDLMETYRDRVIESSYDTAREWARRRLADESIDEETLENLMVVVVNAMVQYQEETTLFGEPPGNIDRETYIDTLTRMITSTV